MSKLDELLSAYRSALFDLWQERRSPSGFLAEDRAVDDVTRCSAAVRDYVASLEDGRREQLDIMWDRRDAAEDALDGTYDTISDLLDQCEQLRERCRVIDIDADWYAHQFVGSRDRAESAERERDELLLKIQKLEQQNESLDMAERFAGIENLKLTEKLEAYSARASLWKSAAKKYRRIAGHFAMRSDKHVEERDAAIKFVAEAADKLTESALLERKLQAVIHAAESVGWNGVDNSKHLTQFIIDLAESAKQQDGVCPYADELKKAKKKIKKLKKKLAHEHELCTMHATAASRLEREIREMRECEDDSED